MTSLPRLKIEHVKPFIDSVLSTMEMMLGKVPKTKRPYLKGQQPNWGDVSGIVGFAGEKVVGSIAISLPQSSALRIFESMVGEEPNSITEISVDVQDSIGELANIVAGNAKSVFSEQKINFNITIPSVIVGKHHNISYKDGDLVLVIPFDMEGEPFCLELLIKVME